MSCEYACDPTISNIYDNIGNKLAPSVGPSLGEIDSNFRYTAANTTPRINKGSGDEILAVCYTLEDMFSQIFRS